MHTEAAYRIFTDTIADRLPSPWTHGHISYTHQPPGAVIFGIAPTDYEADHLYVRVVAKPGDDHRATALQVRGAAEDLIDLAKRLTRKTPQD